MIVRVKTQRAELGAAPAGVLLVVAVLGLAAAALNYAGSRKRR